MRIGLLKTVYVIRLVRCAAATITDRLHESLKLLNLRHALYILIQKTVILSIYRIIRKFLTEECIRRDWSLRLILF
jgi:hypothetical protein